MGGQVYAQMGKDRERADERLAAATASLNEKLAAHSALSDRQFATTVKNLKKAKEEAWAAVKHARKEFTEGIASVTANVKASESRVMGEIQVVSAMVVADAAYNARVNARTDAEMKRVIKLSDKYYSENKRARGAIAKLMNENKRIAADEVAALAKSAKAAMEKLNGVLAITSASAAAQLKKAKQEFAVKQHI